MGRRRVAWRRRRLVEVPPRAPEGEGRGDRGTRPRPLPPRRLPHGLAERGPRTDPGTPSHCLGHAQHRRPGADRRR